MSKLPIFTRIHHLLIDIRAIVRSESLWLICLAAIVGILGAMVVDALNFFSLSLHKILFSLSNNGRLSGLDKVDYWRCLLIPVIGGIALIITRRLLSGVIKTKAIDAVEANALYGGRMSVRNSLFVVLQTLCSNGFGLSLGLEAAYTQLSAAFGSRLGHFFRVRRADMRILVGCGAAGAIGAAFNSPLGGAFYAFEVIIASYTLNNVPPIIVAAICGVSTIHLIGGASEIVPIASEPIVFTDYILASGLALACAGIGIAVMYSATKMEHVFKKTVPISGLRPVIGGFIVGAMALVTPAILGSGHAVLWVGLSGRIAFGLACIILVLKACASSIALGAGFRGGLFFASMLLGTVAGIVYGNLVMMVGIHSLSPLVYALIGMASVSTSIIGAPLTMLFISLDMTSSFYSVMILLWSVVITTVTVQKTFGYSFATWRFHLQGANIQSALDVSWSRALTVGKVMRESIYCQPFDITVGKVRQVFPIGHLQPIILTNNEKEYKGLVSVEMLFNQQLDENKLLYDIAKYQHQVLFPNMSIKEALVQFEQTKAEVLAVVYDQKKYVVLGLLSKSYALMRYNEALEQERKDYIGEYSRIRLAKKEHSSSKSNF